MKTLRGLALAALTCPIALSAPNKVGVFAPQASHMVTAVHARAFPALSLRREIWCAERMSAYAGYGFRLRTSPSLPVHVREVVALRASEQVRWSNAAGVVAPMKPAGTFCDDASDGERSAVRKPFTRIRATAAEIETAVPTAVLLTEPQPTATELRYVRRNRTALVDLPPEPGDQRLRQNDGARLHPSKIRSY